MKKNDIVKISRYDNIGCLNTHHEIIYPPCTIYVVKFRDGSERIADCWCKGDTSDIDYYEYIPNKKTKEVVLFEESIDESDYDEEI